MKSRLAAWGAAVAEAAFVVACFAALVTFREHARVDGVVALAGGAAVLAAAGVVLSRRVPRMSEVALLVVAAGALPVLLVAMVRTRVDALLALGAATCGVALLAATAFLTAPSTAPADVEAERRRLRVRWGLVLALETALALVVAAWNAEPPPLRETSAVVDPGEWPDGGVDDVPDARDDADDVLDVADVVLDRPRDVPRDRSPRDVVRDRVDELLDGASIDQEDVPDDVADTDADDVDDAAETGTCQGGMIFVPEGDPLLGGAPTRRHVTAFCIDRTEVTVDAFRRWLVRNPSAAAPTERTRNEFCNWTPTPAGRESHPINCVNWNDARAYCRGTGGSLPSDDQWEYAARGLDGRTYPWGNDWSESRACFNRYPNGTCVAGATSGDSSPFGVRDLAGNLWEWTESRSVRGASWSSTDPDSARAAYRYVIDASFRLVSLGFRCVRGSRRILLTH